nr:TetR/AcrR family transcriptional regulator [Ketobacter sp. MCCC 1A13808]
MFFLSRCNVPKLNRDKWISAGINQLKEFGPTGISGEQIARRLDVTRGSFYHHFSNMDDFIEALLQQWEAEQTIAVLNNTIANSSDLEEKMGLLMESAWNSDADLEIAIRQWAFINDVVRVRVERTDQLRLGYLIAVYSGITGNNDRGAMLAKIAYYGLLGAFHARPRLSKPELKSLIMQIQALLTEGVKSSDIT